VSRLEDITLWIIALKPAVIGAYPNDAVLILVDSIDADAAQSPRILRVKSVGGDLAGRQANPIDAAEDRPDPEVALRILFDGGYDPI
jgi:hypothetical protein